jgi:uncharacterized protein (TIRG00374 family)
MPNFLKTLFKLLFFTGLGVLLIWLVLKDLSNKDLLEIKNAFANANYFYISISLLLGVFSHIFRAIRWNQLLEPTGFKPKLHNTFLAVLAGYIANLAVPRLGEFTRCALLNKYEKTPLESTIGTVITERIMDTLTMLLFLAIVLITQFDLYYAYILNFLNPLFLKFPVLKNPYLYIIVLILFVLGIIILMKLKKKDLNSKPSQNKVVLILRKFLSGMGSVVRVKNKPLLVLNSFVIWLFYLSTSYINFFALSETSSLGIDAALAVLVWVTFGFIFTQGGLGAYQLIAMQVFSLYGISENMGFALGWIIWSAQTILIIALGGLAFLLFPILNKETDIKNA